jgi:2-polyprenyl-3-methyl-5-hydroxy-6-metoxy-1,4-benzoquinol methylase
MTNIPNRETFENAYAGKAPWDIGKPQPAFVAIANNVTGSILDAGCGTGENALFFAQRGHKVTGIDYLRGPIERAKQKEAQRGIQATFLVIDALHLDSLPQQFDNVIDCGLFHVFSDEDRKRYVAGLASVTKPGGHVFLECFSDDEPGEVGPRRISQADLKAAFAEGWVIESIEPTRFEIRPDLPDMSFSPGGPKAWFATIRRA